MNKNTIPHKTGQKSLYYKLPIVTLFLVTSLYSSVVAAETISVNNTAKASCNETTGAPFCSIQAAINHAQNGDTINIVAGIYKESILITKEITLVGIGKTVALKPKINTNGIVIHANNVTLKNLKIVTSNTSKYKTSAIRIEAADNVSIVNTTIETKGEWAEGIFVCGSSSGCLPSSHLILKNNKITIANYATAISIEQVSPAHSGFVIGGISSEGNTIVSKNGNPIKLYDVSDSEVSYNSFKTIGATCDCSNVIWSSEMSNLSNLIFKNNIIDGSDGTEVAFITNFIKFNASTTKITNVSIENNIFSNWGIRALRIGDTKGIDTSTVTAVRITTNTFNMTTNSLGGVLGGSAADISGTGNIFKIDGEALVESAKHPKLSNSTIILAKRYVRPSLLSQATASKDSDPIINGDSITDGKVLGVSIFNFQKDLHLGSQNKDVAELQKVLITEGFLFYKVTEHFGSFTEQALIQWQAKNGLPSTGYFGPASRAFLNKR